MGTTLLHSHEDVLEARVRVFRALGEENRLRIVQFLAETGEPRNVSEICEELDLMPNLVSHHLQCLSDCTLLEAEQDGRKRFYDIARPEAVELIERVDECIKQDIENVLGCEVVEKMGEP